MERRVYPTAPAFHEGKGFSRELRISFFLSSTKLSSISFTSKARENPRIGSVEDTNKHSTMTAQQVVALFGRQGHGKTTLMNRVTNSRFPVTSGARSCTTQLQFSTTPREGIVCVDTPGFHSSQDVTRHVAAQKIALEGVPLSGVYVVVKHARADDISEMLGTVMDFLGEDVRIIVTHEDVAMEGEGYNRDELKGMLSGRLGIRTDRIVTVGKHTPGSDIENFIATTLHEPRHYAVNLDQLSCLASMCVGTRAMEKRIQLVYAKVQAASFACQELIRTCASRSSQTDSVVALIQHDTTEMVKSAKEELFRWAYEELSTDEQSIVYGKAGLKLSLRLKEFVETTNAYLSYSVTASLSNYRKCPFCRQVFVKTEGCDGQTSCGNAPLQRESRVANRFLLSTNFIPSGTGWSLQFLFEGRPIDGTGLREVLRTRLQAVASSRGAAMSGAGCGAAVTWSQMQPLSQEELKSIGLGATELLRTNDLEELARGNFEESVRLHEMEQRKALADALLH
jgi:GTP-binding protein EngB required for normal cell division